jgi:hypothetical protein
LYPKLPENRFNEAFQTSSSALGPPSINPLVNP